MKLKVGIDDHIEASHRAHMQGTSYTCFYVNALERWNNLPLSKDVFEDEFLVEQDVMKITVPISRKLGAAIKENFDGYSLQAAFDYCLCRELGIPCNEDGTDFIDEILTNDPWYFD